MRTWTRRKAAAAFVAATGAALALATLAPPIRLNWMW